MTALPGRCRELAASVLASFQYVVSERIADMYVSKVKLAVAGVLAAISFFGVGAGTAWAVQTHMINARDALQNALGELQAAEPDKGGHRVNAINLVNQAIGEVNAGIAVGAGQ
jgi:hypothetical protein